jgi:hypothetical protein
MRTLALIIPNKIKKAFCKSTEGLFRGNSWNRTNDTSIFSAVLYQLSYVAVSRSAAVRFGDRKGTNAKQ